MLNSRVYPNGEFSIWDERKTVAVEPPPESPDYLGLSLLPNSHRVALGMAEPPPERAKRGLRGITRLGARTVRNGAFLLEKTYDTRTLVFLTLTLPPVSSTAEYHVGVEWAEIVRRFCQSLRRLLRAAGLPGSYVGCSELQLKRYQERGGLPLHLHLVFKGRREGQRGWAVDASQYRALWARSVIDRVPAYSDCNWKASVDCQGLKSSAEGYIGKYMSKGVGTLAAILKDDPGLAEFMPSSWWVCSTNLRRAIGHRITGGNATALKLRAAIAARDTSISHASEIRVELKDGTKAIVALVGRLSPEGRYSHCWKPGRIQTILT
uniref:Uncharacterized protein n=1 Tax=uncultured prokaryote TaxID=198431 RepID=A0A0H5Q470_9ZZZZ|nr:hypothetical protein [uncultured prokaryote]